MRVQFAVWSVQCGVCSLQFVRCDLTAFGLCTRNRISPVRLYCSFHREHPFALFYHSLFDVSTFIVQLSSPLFILHSIHLLNPSTPYILISYDLFHHIS